MVVVSKFSIFFFTSDLAGYADPSKVEMRLWDLIVLKREGCSRFFEVPIAIVARLSSENESNPSRAKPDQNPITSEADFRFLARFFSTRIELVLQAQMSYDSDRYLKKTRTISSFQNYLVRIPHLHSCRLCGTS